MPALSFPIRPSCRSIALATLLFPIIAMAQAQDPAVAAPEPATAETLDADTPRQTAQGAGFVVPQGWTVQTRGQATLLSPPEAGSTIALVDVELDDADAAIEAAWGLAGLALEWPVKVAVDQPGADGWEQQRMVDYTVPQNAWRIVWAHARRFEGRWTVALTDFSMPDYDRRRGQVGLIFSSLLPPGRERESFAGRTAQVLDEARLAQLSAFVQEAQRALQVPGVALGIVQNGETVLAEGYGVREIGRPEPVDSDTLFMIASNTKAMTTLLLARLVDQGRVQWETPVTAIMPDFRLGDAETTGKVQIQHLVCACTGLPRQDSEWILEFAEATPETAVAALAGMQPSTEFGALYQYSNPLAAAGGFIGAHALHPELPFGEAYDRAMQEHVFDPLGMRRTTFDFDTAMQGNHAAGHGQDFEAQVRLAIMDMNHSIVPVRPTGGAWSNVDDMLRFVQFELDRGLLPDGTRHVSEAALLERREPKVAVGSDTTYGMGLMLDRTWGVPAVFHGGSMIGYKSQMIWLPEHDVGLVLLTNADEGGYLTGRPLLRRLLEVLFDGEPQAQAQMASAAEEMREWRRAERERLRIPADPAEADKLASAYHSDALGRLEVIRDGERTVFDFGEWKSEVASRREDDGAVAFVLSEPGAMGWPFVVADQDGRRRLISRSAQQEYVLEEVAD